MRGDRTGQEQPLWLKYKEPLALHITLCYVLMDGGTDSGLKLVLKLLRPGRQLIINVLTAGGKGGFCGLSAKRAVSVTWSETHPRYCSQSNSASSVHGTASGPVMVWLCHDCKIFVTASWHSTQAEWSMVICSSCLQLAQGNGSNLAVAQQLGHLTMRSNLERIA